MDGAMFNENNTVDSAKSFWWDGTKIRWHKLFNKMVSVETEKLVRPKEVKIQTNYL
jgi:hypothetical protein